ncbi:MAG: efflux RND transporter periplasmic adaptor subunit [Bacteroidales bacterium]|jgi:HlyD family secretion protein|nr:efflux RND transporter periplasmic adaptor subunit [Bacteroidales bacterium]MDY0315105.1 efflux RND transporter periplasmic adaptor subunit [Bacteroidales bacterium]NLB86637.1 efflux RND transporter periplasmic adaptor subunit [Bacteroidales bacterium]
MKKNKSKSKRKIRIIILGIIGLIIVLIIAKKSGLFGSNNMYEVSTEIIEKRTITETVSASGKIQPAMEIKISPDVSGEIVELVVREAHEVKKGDFLLKIKPDLYESALERTIAAGNSANANLENAKARLEQVRAQFVQTELSYNRNKTLYEQNVISESEYENSLAAYQMGLADVSAAEASVNAANFSIMSSNASIKEANENLRKTSVFAPMDGTISVLNVEIGERVVGTEMMAGTEMMRIAKLEDMEVIVDVNENDIVKIKLNDLADIEVDAYLKRKFKGVVTEIANSASSTGLSVDQVTNFKVKIKILNESYQDLISETNKYPFRPGMSASVDIHTNTVFDVIAVPLAAVTTRLDSLNLENQKTKDGKNDNLKTKSDLHEVVFVYKDGKVEQRNVKTGIQDSYYIEILEGVEIDEELVVAPYNLISKILKNDMSVKKLSKENLYKADK